MRCAFVALAVMLCACDSERLRELTQDVQHVKTEQRVLRAEVESTVREQKALQTSVAAMGSGFNVLTETLADQDGRVEVLEARSRVLQRQFSRIATNPRASSYSPLEPDRIGTYFGRRFDARTLQQTRARLAWCESEEGTRGYLAFEEEEPEPGSTRCWRFGDVAIFRVETAAGPQVHCLREVTVSPDGSLQALDCDASGVIYRFTLR